MDTQTMMGLAAGLGWGAAIVQTLRHSAAASRAIRAERQRDAIEAAGETTATSLHEGRASALRRLADVARERNEARAELDALTAARNETIAGLQSTIAERGAAIQALLRDLGAALEQRDAATVARDQAQRELADLAGARDETIRGLRMTIAERDKVVQEMRRELGAVLEQRDAAVVSFEHAQRQLAERTADRNGADLAHADCERRLADMGDRFAALQAACQELREQIAAERAAAGAAQERSRMLDHEVQSLKASLAASKPPAAADRAAGDTEVAVAAPVARKGRRRA